MSAVASSGDRLGMEHPPHEYLEPILYRRLVGERGWSDRAYQRWLTETVSSALL